MNDWIKKAMTRKMLNNIDRVAFIIRNWDLEGDFILYFQEALNNFED
jgi:hypothetical protein